jgi:MFS family permease
MIQPNIQATFVDICNISGARMAVSPITHDLDLPPSQGVWVINAYALSFAAFLLVAGRLADTFQVRILFVLGLVGLGALCLVTSFMNTNKYAFFSIRGISGLFGALIIPSA